jgi:hypothetical protein
MRQAIARCPAIAGLAVIAGAACLLCPAKAEDNQAAPAGVDAFYIISLPQCAARVQYNRRRREGGASPRLLPRPAIHAAVDFRTFSPSNPPLPVVFNERTTDPSAPVTAGQVACTASHRAVWRDAFQRNASVVLVLEDDMNMTPSGERKLASLIRDADSGANVRGRPWHWMFLRRMPVGHIMRKSWHGSVRRARPSWGTAAYVLSWHGVRFMLSSIRQHEAPLDVAVAQLQHRSAWNGFVALDGCARGPQRRQTCAENVEEMPATERGQCAHSTTQAGWRARADEFPCLLPRRGARPSGPQPWR